MKKLIDLLSLIGMTVTMSCKKAETAYLPSANLLIGNFVAGGGTLTIGSTTQTVGSNASNSTPLLFGQNQITLTNKVVTPVATYYNQPLTADNNGNYSLFLGGSSPTLIDPIIIKESYQNFTDSLCAVRFINLSPNSTPVSVNITGQANGSEVTSLAYKAYSSFKQYPAKKVNANYAFQIRDAATGTLLASYSMPTPFFHNATIVLRGNSPTIATSLVINP